MSIAVKDDPVAALVDAAKDGNRLALARLLTQVENDTPDGRAALDRLFPDTGRAHLIGITGSPGTGKSTLVAQLAKAFRRSRPETRVAVIAVDPTSPFTGGAVLGDRVRMRDLVSDPGIFIRSMATRGALGGLARSTASLAQVFDALGYGIVLIETVGAGQSEIDIARLAHTTVVIEAPGLGDDVQSIKAGILEIADILVVNKADRLGADITERILRTMLDLAHPSEHLYTHPRCTPGYPLGISFEGSSHDEDLSGDGRTWTPPVLRTIATLSQGIAELQKAIEEHGDYLRASGGWRRREQERIQVELQDLLQAALAARWRSGVGDSYYRSILAELIERRISPQQAIQALLDDEYPVKLR